MPVKRSSVPTVVLLVAVALVALLVYGVVQQQAGVGSDRLDRAVQRGERPRRRRATSRGPRSTRERSASSPTSRVRSSS